MHVVVLAAGRGTRLQPMTQELPKPMVVLNGKPIIWYVLLPLLELACVQKITVVTGFKHQGLDAYIRRTFSFTDRIHLLHHMAYDKGNLFTLLRARSRLRSTFMVTNADHIFHPKLLTTFTEDALVRRPGFLTIGCHHDRPLTADDMKVRLAQGYLTHIGKDLTIYDAGYLGLTIVHEACRKAYCTHAAATAKKRGDISVVEDVLGQAAQDGMPPRASDLTGLGWYEIDTPEDYAIAEQGLRSWGLYT
jgi:choline kinase